MSGRCLPLSFVALLLSVLSVRAADTTAFTQFTAYSKLLSPEKLYLHTDREVYCVGDTVWFKGYLQNASKLAENPECNYIYVELFSTMHEINVAKKRSEDFERMRVRIKVKRSEDGSFEGYLPLPEDLNSGIAVIRAYSYWMLNRSVDYMFWKNIELRNPMKDEFASFLETHKITDERQYADIYMKNPFRKEWLVRHPKKETGIDMQFFPESGRYLPGVRSVMAVKLLNQEGTGVKAIGRVLADGKEVAVFSTNELGMGRFTVSVPAGTASLTAELETASESFEYTGLLPLPESKAVVINVRCSPETYVVDLSTEGMDLPDSSYFVIHDKSDILLCKPYHGERTSYRIAASELPFGINNAAVVDISGNVYAERCFFVYPERPSIGIKPDRRDFGHREKVRCHIDASLSSQPLKGSFSLSVSDDVYAPMSGKSNNIESWMMLGSEIEGYVEDPQRYFCDTVEVGSRLQEMDLLMLTQGWKYYELPQILSKRNPRPYFGKEYTQSLCGWVNAFIGKAKKSTVFFVAPSINFSCIGELDTCAYFALNQLDFPDSTQFLVGAKGDGLFGKFHLPILYPESFARDYSYPKYLDKVSYSEAYGTYATQSFYYEGGEATYTLLPARKIAYVNGLSPYPNDNFRPSEYYAGKDIEPYADYTVGEFIHDRYTGLLWRDGVICTRQPWVASKMEMPKGGVMPGYVYAYLNGYSVDQRAVLGIFMWDVEAIAVVQGVRASRFSTNGGNLGQEVAVLVKTKMPVRTPHNVTLSKPIGWQKPAKRYVPKYETTKSRELFEPIRPTLHWEPEVNLVDGAADIEFYSSDSEATYTVTLEGLTESGQPVSYTCHIR